MGTNSKSKHKNSPSNLHLVIGLELRKTRHAFVLTSSSNTISNICYDLIRWIDSIPDAIVSKPLPKTERVLLIGEIKCCLFDRFKVASTMELATKIANRSKKN